MKKFRFLTLALCLIVAVATLVACSSANDVDMSTGGNKTDAYYPSVDEKIEDSFDGIGVDSAGGSLSDSATSGEYERQIIKTVKIQAETKAFDTAVSAINGYVSEFGGYVESSEQSGKSLNWVNGYYERYASYTIRIPAENLEAFVGKVGDTLNIVNNNGTQDDVSPQYYDIVSRLETLETEKEALQKMYEKADTIDYMLQVQERLYDVIEEIEAYTTQLNYYKSQVAYSTVHLSISEVIEYTDIVEKPKTYGEEIKSAFVESWKDFADGCRDFSIWFVGAIPTLITLAVIGCAVAAIILLIVRGTEKKRKQKNNKE
ncbi:MAG: DUF4349 domain-containing protein [Clostridia bacterium]|nr:DUF4349 domain-containing protein [Clostridia bacterium]